MENVCNEDTGNSPSKLESLSKGSTNESRSGCRLGKNRNVKYGGRMKQCDNCGQPNAIAQKTCKCGETFKRKTKTAEERMPKKKTNVTEQKTQLQAKALALQRDHEWNVLCYFAKKNVSRSGKVSYMFDSYGTPGWASEFLGPKNAPSEYQKGAFELIKGHFMAGESSEASASEAVFGKESVEKDCEVTKREDIEPMDVLPVYPEPTSKDDFWLFMVTNAETSMVRNRGGL